MRKSIALIFNFSLCLLSACHFDNRRNSANASRDLVIITTIPIGDISPDSRFGIGANLVELLYKPLIKWSGEGKFSPELAKDFRWNEDHSELTVTLREPRSSDVQDTFNRAINLKERNFSQDLQNLKKLELVSPSELIFKLKKFDRSFLDLLTQFPIVTRRMEDSTGDFIVASQSPNEVVLKRKRLSPHLVNTIIVKQVSSLKYAMRELVAGNADILLSVGEGEFKVLTDLEEIVFGELKSKIIYVLLENRKRLRLGPFAWRVIDKKLDRQLLINELTGLELTPAKDPIPKQDTWLQEYSNQKDIESPYPAVNSHLLKSKTPILLSFLGRQSRDSKIARLLKRLLEELGYKIVLKEYSPREYASEVYEKKNFDLILAPYSTRNILMLNYMAFHTPMGLKNVNISNYSNPKVDSFLDEARYSLDEDEAKNSFLKAIHALLEDPPGLFLFWVKTPIVYRRSCSGFSFNSSEFFSSLKDVRCEPSAAN